MSKYSFNFSQIHSGLSDDSPLGNQQTRFSGNKLSNFGAMGYGVANSDDYTKFSNVGHGTQNPSIPDNLPNGDGNLRGVTNNPTVIGSTTLKTRKGEALTLNFSTRKMPGLDIMDSKAVVNPNPMFSFPSEGFRSFGFRSNDTARSLNVPNVVEDTLPTEGLLFKAMTPDMTDTIGVSAKTKPAFSAPTPTYYVNPATGSNGNNGLTAETAFRDIDYAAKIVQPGNTVQIIAPATSPARNGLNAVTAGTDGNPITWRGQSANERAYIVGGVDVSHGAAIRDCLSGGGDMEGWISAGSPWPWTPTAITGNTLSAETTIVHSGAKSAKFVRTTSSTVLEQYRYLPPNTLHTLKGWHYETAAGKYFTVKIQNATTSEYLQTDLTTWGALVGLNQSTSLNAWSEFVIPFTTQDAVIYKIRIELAVSATSYLDDVTLTDNDSTMQWATHSGDTLKLAKLPRATNVLTKCSTTDWSSFGIDALVKVPIASSLANCEATANSWWWESSIIYYHPPAGENIADIHLESGGYQITGDRSETIYCTKSYNSFAFIDTVNANGHAWALNAPNLLVDYCRSKLSRLYGFCCIGAANSCTINDSVAEHSQYATGDGFVSSGLMETNWCISRHNYDEGFESFAAGTLIAKFCISHHNGNANNIDVEGFSCSGDAGSGMELYNCVSAYNAGHGISIVNTTGKFRAYNNISIHNAVYDPTTFDVNASDGQVDFIADYNCSLTNRSFWSAQAGAHELLDTDPLFIDSENGDYHLTAISPCIGAGTDPFVTGDGDQYDADGYMVWSDTFDAPVYHWRDGADIGAYAYGGATKVLNSPTIISGDSMANYVLEMPICPTLYDADDGSIYTGIVPNQINLATFTDTDQMRWGSRCGVMYASAQDAPNIVKIDRAIGNVV